MKIYAQFAYDISKESSILIREKYTVFYIMRPIVKVDKALLFEQNY